MKRDKRNTERNGRSTDFQTSFKKYATQANILKLAGVVSVAGVAIYSAFKFIPFEKIVDKIDEGFNNISHAFEENEFATTENNVEE